MEVSILKSKDNCSLAAPAVLLPVFCVILIGLGLGFDQFACSKETLTVIADSVILSVGVACAGFGLYRSYKGDLNEAWLMALIVTMGFALRLAYVLEYGIYEHQHDVESLKSSGHLSYIYRLSQGSGLPDSNDWQFSHPPLHHILAAGVVWLSKAVGFSDNAAFENIQLLTCLYSVLMLFVSIAIFKECGLKGRALVFSSAVVAFHPSFFIFAGSINNDCLSFLLSLLAIYFLIKWCRKRTLLNAALIGLFLGLGMMTKFSVALIAAVVAITVIVKFIVGKGKNIGSYLAQTGVFLAVMLPLGLWFQIRNMVLFDQPLGYVAPISTDNPLYIGEISLVKRLLLPFSTEPVGVFADVWEEHNLWTYLLRNSLFGEYSFGNAVVALFTVICNLALIIIATASLVMSFKRKNRIKNSATFILGLLWAVQMIFFIYFNISYPFRCTMDFRYISLTAICGAAFIGFFLQKHSENGSKLKPLSFLTEITVAMFAVFSTLAFL